MNIRNTLFTCQRSTDLSLLSVPLLSFHSPYFQTPLIVHNKISTNHNSKYSSAHHFSNEPNTIMTSKATIAAGLTAREVDILCAMCQSLKSKPEVCAIAETPLSANYLPTKAH